MSRIRDSILIKCCSYKIITRVDLLISIVIDKGLIQKIQVSEIDIRNHTCLRII